MDSPACQPHNKQFVRNLDWRCFGVSQTLLHRLPAFHCDYLPWFEHNRPTLSQARQIHSEYGFLDQPTRHARGIIVRVFGYRSLQEAGKDAPLLFLESPPPPLPSALFRWYLPNPHWASIVCARNTGSIGATGGVHTIRSQTTPDLHKHTLNDDQRSS